jgi:hypothetical protein
MWLFGFPQSKDAEVISVYLRGSDSVRLSQDNSSVSRIVLEQEISSFGTGLSTKDRDETEQQYEDTFYDDPGHISRAELRFRKALQAAGGLSMAHVARAKAYYETDGENEASKPRQAKSHKQTLSKWTAFPENDSASGGDGLVNIVINTPKKNAQAASSRFGMSSLAARQDLESYFDGLDNQIHTQERKHVSEVLQRLSSGGVATGAVVNRNSAAGRVGAGGSGAGKGRTRDTSMLRLLQKAMQSQQFRRQVSNLKSELHVDWHTE